LGDYDIINDEYERYAKKNLAVATAGFLVGIILAVMVFVFGYLYFVIGLRNYEDTGRDTH